MVGWGLSVQGVIKNTIEGIVPDLYSIYMSQQAVLGNSAKAYLMRTSESDLF